MVEWGLWEHLLGMGEGGALDSRAFAIDQAVESFVNGMSEDPAYQADATVEGEALPMIASRTSPLECTIKAPPGSDINIGDMVSALQEDWIVVEVYEDKVGIINGKMWVCNGAINFQNNSSPVHTRRCVIDNGNYPKRNTDPIAFVPTDTYKMYLSIDIETRKLYVDKRLAIGTMFSSSGEEILEVFKVIGVDQKSGNNGGQSHLMILTLQRDVYNEVTDSIAQLLCDVFVGPQSNATPVSTGACFIKGKDSIRIGTSKKYIALFNDPSGELVSGITPIWTIDAPEEIEPEITEEGVRIEIPFLESLIGAEITITVADDGGEYGCYEKKVQVTTVG